MTKRNGKGTIHGNMLFPSEKDTIMLSRAVEERFIMVSGLWQKMMFEPIPIPMMLDKPMLLWRQMAVRHKQGDYRNTADELNAVREMAQWTVDMNCKLRNQPQKRVQWNN